MATMSQFLKLPVPDDFYVTNKFREFAQQILSGDEDPGDTPLVELLAEAVFNLESDYRLKLANLEQRIADAGVQLPPDKSS
jgi:hypothetical protein